MDIPQTFVFFYFLTKSPYKRAQPATASSRYHNRACSPTLIHGRHFSGVLSRFSFPKYRRPPSQEPHPVSYKPLAEVRGTNLFTSVSMRTISPAPPPVAPPGPIAQKFPFVQIFFFELVLADFFSNSAIICNQAACLPSSAQNRKG